MSKPKTIFRFDPKDRPNEGFVVISNALAQNPKISRAVKGLILELLSRPKDWRITVQGLMASGPEGRDQLRRLIREAEDAGLLRREQKRVSGAFGRSVYEVRDCGISTADWKTDDGLTDAGKPPTTKDGKHKRRKEQKTSATEQITESLPKTPRTLRDVYERARKLADEMRAMDRNKFLGTPLFANDGHALLAELIDALGYEHMRNAIIVVVTEHGSPLRKGQIRSWRFFEARASAEYVDIPKGA